MSNMKCPFCGFLDSKVIDSRPTSEGTSIRRRRECLSCQKRFTTFEMLETMQITVVKKDGSRELFDKQKLLSGLYRASNKRPIDPSAIADSIESELLNGLVSEVTTAQIGEMAMEKLKAVDDVAYVRFASVYREFKDVDTFLDELKILRRHRPRRKKKVKDGE